MPIIVTNAALRASATALQELLAVPLPAQVAASMAKIGRQAQARLDQAAKEYQALVEEHALRDAAGAPIPGSGDGSVQLANAEAARAAFEAWDKVEVEMHGERLALASLDGLAVPGRVLMLLDWLVDLEGGSGGT